VYARYEQEKRKRRLLDFDDVLRVTSAAIEDENDFAAGQRWLFRHIFVDEFQDTTPLQLRLLRAWLGPNPDLTVVGDPAQAIYAFAGADAAPLIEFERAFPGGTIIALTRTYRSTPAIVRFAESALHETDTGARASPLPVREEHELPSITAYADDAAEAAGVAVACRQAHLDGVPWHRIAVLFRSNAQSARFESALAQRGVPFRTGDDRRFVQQASVRVLFDRLRAHDSEHPGRSLGALLADLAGDTDDIVDPPDGRAHRDDRHGHSHGRGNRPRRRSPDVPSRQGARMGRRVRHRHRGWPRSDRRCGHARVTVRRAPAVARRAQPSRGFAALFMGSCAHHRSSTGRPAAFTVARRPAA